MEVKVAITKAYQVLGEERVSPTVDYCPAAPSSESMATGWGVTIGVLGGLTAIQELHNIHFQRPRAVSPTPERFSFRSTNYELLCQLYSQVPVDSRASFVTAILKYIGASPPNNTAPRTLRGKSWSPLIAEFCVRNGETQALFAAIAEANPTQDLVTLLHHIEEMIAVDYRLLQDAEYGSLALTLNNLLTHAAQTLGAATAPKAAMTAPAKLGKGHPLYLYLCETSQAIREEARKARYYYLRQELTEGWNLEVNQDKNSVQEYLRRLGFPEVLSASLDEVERSYYDGANGFDRKASMGHLRSFLENLHSDAVLAVNGMGGGPFQEWGPGLAYLRTKGVLSAPEERFAASLYTIISDGAVHPLITEREYARLMRNVAIEYALLLLKKLDKLGVKRN